MTGHNPPDDLPTMAAALPQVTTRLVAILQQMGYPDLAETLSSQRFYGRCPCKPGCTFAFTAPPGTSGTYMIWLELDGQDVAQADLDPDGRTITAFELAESEVFGVAANWLDQLP